MLSKGIGRRMKPPLKTCLGPQKGGKEVLMTITILRRFGGVKAVVAEDLMSAHCEIGSFDISWCSERSINYARVSPYARDHENWRAWFAKHGVSLPKEEIKIKIEDDDKKRLVMERQKRIEELKKDFFDGKIRIFCSVSRDAESPWIEKRTWKLKERTVKGENMYDLVWDILHSVNMEKWCPSTAEDGEDITEQVLAEYHRRRERCEQQKKDAVVDKDYVTCVGCGRRFTYEEAKRIGFDFATRYCGC
jgi:Fe-S cluster biosynthesis and repair protein YggX